MIIEPIYNERPYGSKESIDLQGVVKLTWKCNYISVNEKIQEKHPESGINILDNPECILTYKGALISVAAYWYWKDLNEKSDVGAEGDNVDSITRVINLYTKSYTNRRSHFNIAKDIFNINV